MPWPETAYITNAMTTSRQPRPQPHMTGTAAATARSGTTMNAARRTCSIRARLSVPGTDASGPWTAPVTADGAGGRTRFVVGADMQLISSLRRFPVYLRQRNLRHRRLDDGIRNWL